MRFTEVSLCLCLALVVHFGAWFWPSDGGVSSAGNGGDALVSLEASSPSLAALIEIWDTPVSVHDTPPKQPSPETAPELKLFLKTAPVVEQNTSPVSKPTTVDLPQLSIVNKKPPTSLPHHQQKKLAKRPSVASSASPQETAAGVGQSQAQGVRGTSDVSTQNVAQNAKLVAQWGARIRRSIERLKRYPKGTNARGKVYVQLTVLRNGQLASLRINKPSSDSKLDNAALEAVRRARFPKAPKGFYKQQQTFNLPISFSR